MHDDDLQCCVVLRVDAHCPLSFNRLYWSFNADRFALLHVVVIRHIYQGLCLTAYCVDALESELSTTS